MKSFFIKFIACVLTSLTLFSTFGYTLAVLATGLDEYVISDQTESSTNCDITDVMSEPYVVLEDTTGRQEYEKRYVLSDGSYVTATYGVPVHYLDEGEWIDIDNSFVKSENGYKEVNPGRFSAEFDSTDSNRILQVKKDGYEIELYLVSNDEEGSSSSNNSFSKKIEVEEKHTSTEHFDVKDVYSRIEEATQERGNLSTEELSVIVDEQNETNKKQCESMMELNNLSSGLKFINAVDNTDLEYLVTPSSVKENIVIKEKENQYVYSFSFVTDLTPVVNRDNSMVFVDENGVAVFSLPAPFMYDNKGEVSSDVYYSIKEDMLTVTASCEWINDPAREFPITIDPTLVGEGIINIEFNNLREQHPNNTYMDAGYMAVGFDHEYEYRTLLRFSNLPSFIRGSVIESATLKLFTYETAIFDHTFNRLDAYAFENTETWNSSTVTWATKPSTNSQPFDYQIIRNRNTNQLVFNITDLMERWYTGDSDFTKGITLKVDEMYRSNNYCMYSFFRTANYGATNHPILTLKFRSNIGLDDRYSYSQYSASDAGTAYIGNNSGNMILVKELTSGDLVEMPACISLIYNSALFMSNNQSFGVGSGWRINYQETISSKTIDDSTYYVYTTADGDELYFAYDSTSGVFKDVEDLGFALTVGDGYEITFHEESAKIFDDYGRLSEIVDNESGDSIIVDYVSPSSNDFRISKITDGDGNEYNFTYNSGLIETIYDPDNNEYSFTLQTVNYLNCHLLSITDPDGKTVLYEYEPNNAYIGMTSAVGSDGHGLFFEYTGPTYKKVSKVTELYGQTEGSSVYYEIHSRHSIISDELGNSVVYQFDNTGKLISIIDGQGYAQYYDYFDGSGSMGLINSISSLKKTTVNMASDPSFEALTSYVNVNSDYVLDGAKSAHLSGQNEFVRETFTGIPEETYTVSVYVKCETLTPLSDDYGAFIQVSSGNETWQSDMIRSTTYNDGWDRLAVSFTVPSDSNGAVNVDLRLAGATGDVYFDLLGIDKGDVVNKVNFVTDGDFDNTVAAVTVSTPASQSNKAIALAGSPLSAASYSRDINVSGTAGEELTFGSYAKGDSADQRDGITFGLRAELYSGSTMVTEKAIAFNSHVHDWQYVCGSIIAEDDFDRVVLTYTYDYNINAAYFDGLTLYREPLGTKYSYYDDGNIETVVTPGESTVYYEYNSDGDVTLCQTVGECETVYVYDNDRNLLYTETMSLGDNVTYETVVYTYSGDDILTETVYKVGYSSVGSATPVMQTVNTYSDSKLVTQTVTDNTTAGKTVVDSYSYDTNGNVTTTTRTVTEGNTTETTSTSSVYDEDGNITSSIDEMGNVTSYAYDSDGRVTTTSISDGISTKTQTYTYTDGELTALTGSATGCTSISIALSYAGNDVSTIVTPTTTYHYVYDTMDRYAGVSVGNHILENIVYDVCGRQVSKSYGNRDSIVYGYNPSNLLTSVTIDTNKTFTYKYNADGQIGCIYDPYLDETEVYLYNTEKELIKRDTATGKTVWYDKDGMFAASLIGGEIYTIEQDGESSSFLSDSLLANVAYSFDDFGRIGSRSLGDGATSFLDVTYSYKTVGSNETSLIDSIDAGAFTFSYSYDGFGNVTEMRRNNFLTNRYEYDGYGRVVREDISPAYKTYTYSYDDAGNITEKKQYSFTTGSLENKTPNKVYIYTYDDSTWEDLLTSFDGQSILYDNIGNPLSYRGKILSWNGRRLESIGSISYTYDVNGLRTSKTKGNITTYFTWENGNLIHQTNGTTSIHFWYGEHGAEAFTYISGSTSATYYYVKDALGNVIGIYDDTGDMLVRYDYDAWGYPVTTWYKDDNISAYKPIGDANPIRYKGYYYDLDTQLYYLQSRFYDPKTGRFLNGDDVHLLGTTGGILGFNLMSYCEDNPVMYIDTLGESRVAVFYDARTSGYPIFFYRMGGVGFERQGQVWVSGLKKRFDIVESYPFYNIKGFVDKWNKASKQRVKYDFVIIISHGAEGSMDCSQQRLICPGIIDNSNTLFQISKMRPLVTTGLYLFACHGGTISPEADKDYNSLARLFLHLIYPGYVVAAVNGKVNINPYNGTVTINTRETPRGSWKKLWMTYKYYCLTYHYFFYEKDNWFVRVDPQVF